MDEGLHTLGIQPEEELSCATMAGLLLERLGHIPAAGESLFFWGHLWTVASMDGLRIDQIRIHPQRSGDITEKVNKNARIDFAMRRLWISLREQFRLG